LSGNKKSKENCRVFGEVVVRFIRGDYCRGSLSLKGYMFFEPEESGTSINE